MITYEIRQYYLSVLSLYLCNAGRSLNNTMEIVIIIIQSECCHDLTAIRHGLVLTPLHHTHQVKARLQSCMIYNCIKTNCPVGFKTIRLCDKNYLFKKIQQNLGWSRFYFE